MKKQRLLYAATVVSFLVAAFLLSLTHLDQMRAQAAYDVANRFVQALQAGDYETASNLCMDKENALAKAQIPASVTGQALYDAYYDALRISPYDTLARNGLQAYQRVFVTRADWAALTEDLTQSVQRLLEARLEAAQRADEIYDEDLQFRKDAVEAAFADALREALSQTASIETLACGVYYAAGENGAWAVADCAALENEIAGCDFDALAADLYADVSASLVYTRKRYALPQDTHEGPVPDEAAFGETDDPAEIEKLLQRPLAKQLIDGRDLYWKKDLPFLPNEPLSWYLDETILVLVWKEENYGAAGTYAEIFLSDASQLCRKIVDDTYDANRYQHATQLAQDANAVLAIGGDLYDHPGRRNGVHVYDGEVRFFDGVTTECCFFTGEGELLMIRRNQFATEEEAQAFVDEHDARFSVCFGPILIEDGKDVTPEAYPYGEINDRYARGAIGKKDDGLHYLTLNMNQQGPTYWSLSLLSEATDEMMTHGVTTAYALDGGQTCCTILNGKLINRVQHDEERDASDVIFFATALPEKPSEAAPIAPEAEPSLDEPSSP